MLIAFSIIVRLAWNLLQVQGAVHNHHLVKPVDGRTLEDLLNTL